MDIVRRYHDAMRHRSAGELADLYAEDGVHEFPFRMDGMPAGLNGREEIRATYAAMWGATPFRVTDIGDVVIHQTTDPEVVIAEHTVHGTVDGDTFTVPGLLVLRVRGGQIVHTRDYMDATSVGRLRR